MPEKISILKESGETLNSNIVSIFMIPDTEKKYVITTENAVDPHGLTVLHVSELVDGNLQRVATDEEWSSIKTIMRAIISGNVGTFQYLPVVENVNASGQYSRDISVSSTAANQMINSYNNGEKNLVNQQAQQPEAIQPIQDIGVANNQPVVPVAQPAMAQPAVNPGVVNVGMETAPVTPAPIAPVAPAAPVQPVVPETQVLTPGVNPAMPVNPVNPIVQPVVPVAQPAPVQPEVVPTVVETPPAQQPIAEVGLDQTATMPIVNNVVPMSTVTPAAPENNAADSLIQPVINPVAPVVVDANESVNPVLGGSQVPEGQIVQPTDVNVVPLGETSVGSFAPDASLDDVVVASQQMFMEGVKNLVQTIQEKVYRELYAKEEELKKREEELAKRENGLTGMTNPMDSISANPESPIAPLINPDINNQVGMQSPTNMVPASMVGQPGEQQPTMVSVSNDVTSSDTTINN